MTIREHEDTQLYEVCIATKYSYRGRDRGDKITLLFEAVEVWAFSEGDAAEKVIASVPKLGIFIHIALYEIYRSFANKLSRCFFKTSKNRIVVVLNADTPDVVFERHLWFLSSPAFLKYEWADCLSSAWEPCAICRKELLDKQDTFGVCLMK